MSVRTSFLAVPLSLLALAMAGCGAGSRAPGQTTPGSHYVPPPAVVSGQTTTQASPPSTPEPPLSNAKPALGNLRPCEQVRPRGAAAGFFDVQAKQRLKAALAAVYATRVQGRYLEIHQLLAHLRSPDVRFIVGNGVSVCRAASDLVFLDPRSDAGWVVLYLHSDSHAVFRIVADGRGHGQLARLDRPGKTTAVSAG